jgi:hypothetical protein
MKQPKPATKPAPAIPPRMSDRERRDQMRKDFDRRFEAEKRSRQK